MKLIKKTECMSVNDSYLDISHKVESVLYDCLVVALVHYYLSSLQFI